MTNFLAFPLSFSVTCREIVRTKMMSTKDNQMLRDTAFSLNGLDSLDSKENKREPLCMVMIMTVIIIRFDYLLWLIESGPGSRELEDVFFPSFLRMDTEERC